MVKELLFYLIGQVLVANKNTIIVIDEPELHIHKSILAKLWDKLIAKRDDCGFVFMTHDLGFFATRNGQKFFIKKFVSPDNWIIDEIPENTRLSVEITTQILGSEKQIVICEGGENSLDFALYSACFPDKSIIPGGSCKNVINSVSTIFNNCPNLFDISCFGIIDRDDLNDTEIEKLNEKNLFTLPVIEVENMFLYPDVIKQLCKYERFNDDEIKSKVKELKDIVFGCETKRYLEFVSLVYCMRRINRIAEFSIFVTKYTTICEIEREFESKIINIKPREIYDDRKIQLAKAFKNKHINKFLAMHDEKSLLYRVGLKIFGREKEDFLEYLIDILLNNRCPQLNKTLRRKLPKFG